MTSNRKRAFILLVAGVVIVSGFFTFATVGVGQVVAPALAAKSGEPPHDPYMNPSDDTPFYPDLPDPDCAQHGEPHEYTRDEPKESKHSFGPALGGGGTDEAIIEDFLIHLCGEGGFADNAIGPDRMFGRAAQAAAFGIDPNQPFDDTWREDLYNLVGRIDWPSITVERNVMSAPGTWSMYMYVDDAGVIRVGVVEVKPRLGTYLVVPVYVPGTGYVTVRSRADCGGQFEFLSRDQVPAALL